MNVLTMRLRRIPIPCEIWFLVLLGSVAGMFSANPLLTIVGTALVPIFFALLWLAGDPPVLLFAVCYQWLQVFVPVVNANLSGIDMANMPFVPNLESAVILGFAALLCVALGMHLGLRGRRVLPRPFPTTKQLGLTPRKLLLAYIVAQVILFLAQFVSEIAPSFRQQLIVLGLFRWAIVFLIFWAGFTNRHFRRLAIALLVLEIGLGLMQFFSAFKFVLFLAIVVALTCIDNPRRLLRPQLLIITGLILLIGGFWQAIKGDYRVYLNQGTASQAVLASPAERIDYLISSILSIDLDSLQNGFASGVQRTGYLEYFAHSITMVPGHIPYQQGQLWSEALAHIFMPRLLFPNKAPINDSERVNAFTGVRVAGADQGASISLGYVAESFIDFGPVLMFVPIFLLGLFWGWTYRVLACTGPYRLLSVAMATSMILSEAILFESSNIKILGGGVTNFLVVWILLRFCSRHIWSFIGHKRLNKNFNAPR